MEYGQSILGQSWIPISSYVVKYRMTKNLKNMTKISTFQHMKASYKSEEKIKTQKSRQKYKCMICERQIEAIFTYMKIFRLHSNGEMQTEL